MVVKGRYLSCAGGRRHAVFLIEIDVDRGVAVVVVVFVAAANVTQRNVICHFCICHGHHPHHHPLSLLPLFTNGCIIVVVVLCSSFLDDDILDDAKVKRKCEFKIDNTKIIIEITTPNRVSPSPYVYIRWSEWRNGRWIQPVEPYRWFEIRHDLDMTDRSKNRTKIWLLKIINNSTFPWIYQGHWRNDNEQRFL